MHAFVKQCPGCPASFSLADFRNNPEIHAIGMQFGDADFQDSLYYFNHECPRCGTTFVVSVLEFLPLIDEVVPETSLAGSDTCGGHCTRIDDLAQCDNPCRYAPFRRFLLKLRHHAAEHGLDRDEKSA